MENELENFWKREKRETNITPPDVATLIGAAQKRKNATLRLNVGSVFILLLTLIIIASFFLYVAKFNMMISHIGSMLMMGGVIVRILIECYSIFLSTKIDLTAPSAKVNTSFFDFYVFRKRIHGPVTITILILYTIGFYLLTPEFSRYFSLAMMILMHLSYVIGALIVGLSIRRAIRKETMHLDEIKKLQLQIMQ